MSKLKSVTSLLILTALFLVGFYTRKRNTPEPYVPPVIQDERWGSDWLMELSQEPNRIRLSKLLTELKSLPPGEGGVQQTEFFKILNQLNPNSGFYSENYMVQYAPTHQALDALDDLLGDGASEEFMAHWLYRVGDIEIGMRVAANDKVSEYLIQKGEAALPALFRVIQLTEMPPKLNENEIRIRFRRAIYHTIEEIGSTEFIPVFIDDGRGSHAF